MYPPLTSPLRTLKRTCSLFNQLGSLRLRWPFPQNPCSHKLPHRFLIGNQHGASIPTPPTSNRDGWLFRRRLEDLLKPAADDLRISMAIQLSPGSGEILHISKMQEGDRIRGIEGRKGECSDRHGLCVNLPERWAWSSWRLLASTTPEAKATAMMLWLYGGLEVANLGSSHKMELRRSSIQSLSFRKPQKLSASTHLIEFCRLSPPYPKIPEHPVQLGMVGGILPFRRSG